MDVGHIISKLPVLVSLLLSTVCTVCRVWVGGGLGSAGWVDRHRVGSCRSMVSYDVSMEFVEFVAVSGCSSIAIVLEPASWVSQ